MSFSRCVSLPCLAFLLAWLFLAFWNFAKPLPAGTHMVSLTARVPESDVDFLVDSPGRAEILAHELALIDRAEQMIVLDQSPLAPQLAQRLLARKRLRPFLKVVLVTDPANEAFGGTRAQELALLAQGGIMLARVRLERLRDSNPLYSAWWRLCCEWWSDPFDETPGEITFPAWARMLNFKSDQRQLMVADDGAGAWTSVVASAPSQAAGAHSNAALMIRGPLAHDIAASELLIAGWSADDDRLPAAPQIGGSGVGSIDARFLTEGAVDAALLDAVAAANGNDQISIAAYHLSDRQLIGALLSAASRGVRLQVLLDPNLIPNRAAAGELMQGGAGHIEVHWHSLERESLLVKLLMVRHGTDIWMNLGSANFTRRHLRDLNLSASVELRMPARAAPARAVNDYFAKAWASAVPYAEYCDESRSVYWRYWFAEATGLSSF